MTNTRKQAGLPGTSLFLLELQICDRTTTDADSLLDYIFNTHVVMVDMQHRG